MYRDLPPDAPILVAAFHGSVFGLDPRSGEVRWTCKTAVADVRLYVSDVFVLALASFQITRCAYLDGTPEWEARVPFYAQSLLVRGAGIFVAGSGEIACFDLVTGALSWHNKMKGEGVNSVALGFPFDVAQIDKW